MPGAVALAPVLLVVAIVALIYLTVSRRSDEFYRGAETAMQRDDVDFGKGQR